MDYSAANPFVWVGVIQLGIIAAALLIANGLRRKVTIIRKSLMPTAALAGFLLLVLRTAGMPGIDNAFFETIIYHSIAVGFIALSLQVPSITSKRRSHGGLKSGMLIVSVYLVQGIIGLIVSLALSYSIRPDLFRAAGLLLPMSFGQGSGQANNIGSTFEALGFTNGTNFGLSLAAAGYLCACFVGVAYIAYLAAKKKITLTEESNLSESVSVNEFQDKGEIPISLSVDKLSIQIALIFFSYAITYLVIWGATSFLTAVIAGIGKLLNPILWGFNFIIASAIAILIRTILHSLKNQQFIKRQYQNNYLLSRISGLAFDLMIVTGIASINLSNLAGLWLPFVLLVTGGAVVTLLVLKKLAKRLYPDHYYEGLLSMYGMLTGTISSGILLLREVDPNFKTPAANNLVLGSSFAILFGAPILILLGIAPLSDSMTFLVLALTVLYLIILLTGLYRITRKKSRQ